LRDNGVLVAVFVMPMLSRLVFRPFLPALVTLLLLACALPCVAQPSVAQNTQPSPPELAPDWHKGVFMEVFVRSFRDSNGDGIGDLKGLTQSLDYLQSLGVRGIWLMPITSSADGDHGYATADFRAIERAYGTLADFDELLVEAHRRGIGIVMDYVLNHAAATHPQFVSAVNDRQSPYRDWFIWADTKPEGWNIWGKDPWYPSSTGHFYATFGAHMPDYNFRNPAVLDYHLASIKFWLDRGIDGFRFDAVPHLVENSARDWNDQPQSYEVMQRVMALVNQYPHRFTVCEATASPVRWSAPNICGSAFAFGLEHRIMDAAKAKPGAAAKLAEYFTIAPGNMSTMLANHDIFAGERIWDQVRGNTRQYRLAAATLLLLPGTAFIYYGEEIGMAGARTLKADPKIRTPYSWTADAKTAGFTTGTPYRALSTNNAQQNHAIELKRADGLMAFYRDLIQLRTRTPALLQGDYRDAKATGNTLSFTREFDGEKLLVLFNYGSTAAKVRAERLPKSAKLAPVWSTSRGAQRVVATNARGEFVGQLPAQSVMVYRVPKT
jgi:alpha-amylase